MIFSPSKLVYLSLLAVALLSFSGCSDPEYSLMPLSGTVTLRGKPLANAQIMFSPVGDQPGPSSYATTDDQGQYQLVTLDQEKSGAVVGMHRVTITTSRALGSGGEGSPISRELVPRPYRDGTFQVEVPSEGSTEVNVEVTNRHK